MRRQRLTRDESRAQTRERLLTAAGEVFARHGYAGSTVDEIAEHAGYSKGAFYSNFDSKEGLFLTLLQAHEQREIAALQALLESENPARELPSRIAQYYREAETDVDFATLSAEFQLQAARDAEFSVAFRAAFAAHRSALARLLSRFYEKTRRTPPSSLEDQAALLMATAVGLALQRKALGEAWTDVFSAALQSALTGRP